MKRAIVIALSYLLLAILFCAPLFRHPYALGAMDWDEKFFHYGTVVKSAIEYGQLPFWNPWQCGGNVLWQNPLIPILSPVYPLAPILTLALAAKVEIVLHYWIGLIGMHLLLTEVLEIAFLPAIVYLDAMFVLCGAMAIHLAVGHSVLLPAFYLPWQLYFYLRAVQTGRVRDALLGGVALALMIYNAGLHMVSMTVVATAGMAFSIAAMRRSFAPIAQALTLGVAGLLYSAPKLLPTLLLIKSDRFWDGRAPIVHPDRMTFEMVLRQLTDPYQGGRLVVDDVQRWRWFEYANYMGSLAPLLFVACLVWIAWKQRTRAAWLGWSLAGTAVLLLLWSAGDFSPFAPASIAAHLPLLSKFRVPSRFTIVFGLFAATTIGWTWRLVERMLPAAVSPLAGLVFVLATVQIVTQNQGYFYGTFLSEPLHVGFRLLGGTRVLVTDRTTNADEPNSPMVRALVSDRSVYNCYESFQLVHGADPDGPLVVASGDSRITGTSFTPNRVEFSVAGGREPATIVLNQNYAEGWRSSAGPVVLDGKTARPAVTVPPGTTGTYSFSFLPPGLWTGIAVLMAAAGCSPLLWSRRLV